MAIPFYLKFSTWNTAVLIMDDWIMYNTYRVVSTNVGVSGSANNSNINLLKQKKYIITHTCCSLNPSLHITDTYMCSRTLARYHLGVETISFVTYMLQIVRPIFNCLCRFPFDIRLGLGITILTIKRDIKGVFKYQISNSLN